jgi:Methyltransferase domain/Glycosyltransferase family 9 (heptosyltransferase)
LTDTIRVRFEHGLGDCVYFAHQLPLYLRRGFGIVVSCSPDKEILFRAAGVPVAAAAESGVYVPWFEGEAPTEYLRFDNYWKWSKLARNLSLEPMPDIGHPAALWDEYCAVALDAQPFISDEARTSIDRYASGLPPPLVLLHAQGETDPDRKNIPLPLLRRICHELLSASEATILLLDWNSKTPPLPHWRVRHVQHDFGLLDTGRLLSLLNRADLIVGVDSGPLHAARFTRTPSIGIWMRSGSPATWSLPRELQVNIVVGRESRRWTRHARLPFNILECEEPDLLPALLGRAVTRMLAGSRYLSTSHLGRDVLLQQFVRDWQGAPDNAFGGFNDRDRGFDQLLRTAGRRFTRPLIVETGCIRSEEDFRGAGFSTLILGIFAVSRGGELISIDHEPAHCDFARRTVASLGEGVEVIEGDSVEWLAGNRRAIDVLYLDSRDSDQAGCAEQGLCEVQAAEDGLHHASIVVFDDTCYANGGFIGLGALGVPWLLERGWRILHSGHQTILSRLTS